jgi:hypothetical protein
MRLRTTRRKRVKYWSRIFVQFGINNSINNYNIVALTIMTTYSV